MEFKPLQIDTVKYISGSHTNSSIVLLTVKDILDSISEINSFISIFIKCEVGSDIEFYPNQKDTIIIKNGLFKQDSYLIWTLKFKQQSVSLSTLKNKIKFYYKFEKE